MKIQATEELGLMINTEENVIIEKLTVYIQEELFTAKRRS